MENRKGTMSLRKLMWFLFGAILISACRVPITAVLEKGNTKVRLSQVRKQKATISSQKDSARVYSPETEKKMKGKYAVYEKDESTGEDIMSMSLADVNIVAKNKNVPERAGMISLDFKVVVPAALINNKWQVRLTPFADKNGKIIEFDKILISGALFFKQQEKGYLMYQNFINSIIPDSTYMQHLFDMEGYQKTLLNIEEQFYYSWQMELLSQQRFIDWRNVRNKRQLLFNGVMERNRSSVNPTSWKNALPSYWLERNMTNIPGQWNNFLSPEYHLEQKSITPTDSIEISKRFFDYKRMMENERKKAILGDKYNEYVRFPKESCKLDTVIQNGDNFEYYYSQKIEADEAIKLIKVTTTGEVVALDESRYNLPQGDTLTYYISSMVQFLDRSLKYKNEVITRHAKADVTALVNYKSGSTRFDEKIGENKEEIDKVLEAMHKLTSTGELVLDSVNMVATSSPEGPERMNEQLSIQRAKELKRYLLGRTEDTEGIELFQSRAIGEDWEKLTSLIRYDEKVLKRSEILRALSGTKKNDAKERVMRDFQDYAYIRKELYPKLRAVNFRFHLHRREMVKDTIHTTVIDTAYMAAIELMENRKYSAALETLTEHNDYNTAVCMMSLGYDKPAIEILQALKDNENSLYLLAILYVREKRTPEAIAAFKQSCALDASKWYRGQLDPEINQIITDYKLNFEQ